ncbi:MAG: chromosome segregation protein SMC [Bacillus sp. (in: Bacteria)]|nr:chromosome segregation protein SMC [Bacillus sp. (in: firmicutes)]
MFLKRLDVVGFKSFADRVSVEFVPGVTAVVGPNGSGKSNITDAIRWVLGEQSAKSLRGSKMEDIIFAGSDTRKPLNFAEVSLTLENEDQFLPIDYNEVCITRRVYRSGESEFYINQQPCRLKDIIDLFMDSGLGKESFSIIGQGRVEEILNSKAEDRRSIFEEAAGVLKYKTRKKKAELKLKETEENLHRVNDILYELESQVEPLQIQASIAKDYLAKKEELEQIEVALTVHEIEELHHQWETLSKQLELHQEQEMELSSSLNAKEALLEQLRDQITALDESISDLQNVLLITSEELEKIEGRKEVLKERKKNAAQNKIQLQKNIEEATEKISALEQQKAQLEKEYNEYKKTTEQLKEELKEKQLLIKSFSENLEELMESLKGDYIEWLNKQATAKNEIQYLTQQLEQIERKQKQLLGENEKFLEQRKDMEDKKVRLESALTEVNEQLNTTLRTYRETQIAIERMKNQLQKKESALYEAYQLLQKATSRKEMLEEMEAEYSGFFQGVKAVLKARDQQLQGIHGAIAELVQVPKNYEVAIETALGGAMQHIVVETEHHARMAIQYLKQHQSGRATFLPLEVIKGKSIPSSYKEAIQSHPSFIGVAANVIHFEPQYQDVIDHLLGNVIIASDLKGANDIAKQMQYRYRIVTLDGDIVNPGGSMSGGAIKQKTTSLLSRKGELEQLIQKIPEMDRQISNVEKQLKTLKTQIVDEEKRLEELRREGEQLRLQEQALKAEYREVELAEANVNERLSLYDREQMNYVNEQTSIQQRMDELKQVICQTEDELARINHELSQLNERKQTEQTSKETLTNEISDLKATLAAKNENYMNCKMSLERVENELKEMQQKRQHYEEDLMLLEQEMTDSHSGEQQLEEAALKKMHDKKETSRLISLRRKERLSMQQQLEDVELEVKELKRQYKGISETMKDEEVKLNRLDVELDNRLAHLREEYMLSFEAAKQDYPLTVSVEEARKKVKLIKMSIEELGTVNLGAIDEYERVSERYQFLMEQKNDLEHAKQTLFQVIQEMDTEMKKRFEQTFTAIRDQFEDVFRALFGGGRAELKLTDPSDLLHTGVEIVAQPPGKKLQNLALLSGGERALTAIALLFSILKVRPVPFCVLDEVEAALDEANVYRFSKFLKQFSKETQFIVITHRKGTMEEADVLYGVTMQESGVSKMVSVRLEETNDLVKS